MLLRKRGGARARAAHAARRGDDSPHDLGAIADNRAVVIYPTSSRGVGEPIVYTADPSSCRGARHLAFDHRGRLRRRERVLFFAAVTVTVGPSAGTHLSSPALGVRLLTALQLSKC